MPSTPWGPYPWEPGGAWNQGGGTATGGGYDPSQPIGGSVATGGDQSGATGGTTPDAVNQTLAALAQQYGGMPVAPPTPATYKDPYTGEPTGVSSGNMLYTFPNGYTAEIAPNGGLGTITPPKTQTTADVAAQAGVLMGPSGQIYVKNPTPDDGRGPYVLSTNDQLNQQLANAKTVAETGQTQASGQASLTNAASTAARVGSQNVLDVAQAGAATTNAASTAARVGAQNQLDVAQANAAGTNAASTALNAQSTAARVGSQNALDIAQAQAAAQNAATTAGRLPSQIALDTAQAANQQAAAQSALMKANEPTAWTPNITAPTTQYYDPTTGQVVTQQNPNYLPTDPGRMAAQLKQQADSQWQSLQQQVAQGKLSADQAGSQFDRWWSENAEPMKSSIAMAQATQQSALAQQAAQTNYYNAQAANLPATLAQNASDAAQKNAIAMLPYTTGTGYGQAVGNLMSSMGTGKFPTINPQALQNAATFSLPNLQEIGRQGAAAALANISPTAAMHAQTPGPLAQPPVGGLPDLSSMLNLSNYGFSGAPQAPPAGAMPPATAAPATPTPYDWSGLLARQQQSNQEQALQAQIPWGSYQPAGV